MVIYHTIPPGVVTGGWLDPPAHSRSCGMPSVAGPGYGAFFGGGVVSDRLTLATSTGLPLLAMAFHVGTGLIALVAGFIAIAVRKGGTWHRRSGLVFVYAMLATGLTAAGIAAYEGKPAGGVVIVYFVFTAWTAVRPLPRAARRVDAGLMVLAFAL